MEGCQDRRTSPASPASMLGEDVEVRHSGHGGVHRLVVGDQSQVEVD